MSLFKDFFSWVKEIRDDFRVPSDKKLAFTPTADLMEEDKFWQMIGSAKLRAKGDYDNTYREISKDLLKLSPEEIMLFNNRLKFLIGRQKTWDLLELLIFLYGGCEEESFAEFREWLVGQGREFYYSILMYPETMIDADRELVSDVDWAGLAVVPGKVFFELTEEEIPELYAENETMIGTEWDEDSDDLKNRFPKLWEKYEDNMTLEEWELM